MNRNVIVFVSIALVSLASLVGACSSSTDDGSGGPKNQPPPTGTTPQGAPPGTPPGASPPGNGSSSGACTGPTFDNSRIPGWPTVPSP